MPVYINRKLQDENDIEHQNNLSKIRNRITTLEGYAYEILKESNKNLINLCILCDLDVGDVPHILKSCPKML